MDTAEIKKMATKYIINTYGERQLALVRGKGCYVWDADGGKYLDFLGGLAVNGLGHCHPKVVEAVQEQAEKLLHVSNLYYIEPQAKLAKLLIDNSTMEQCFFCNSGAEANEAAIKLARKYTKEKIAANRFSIITMENSFHGRTLTTITATAQPKYHKGFEPMTPGFKYVPFDDLEAVKNAIDNETCAILVEPIQSEGGVNVPSPGYLEGLRALCDENNLLLVFDEVQTAMGRLGKFFGYQSYGIEPDILTMAKSLGGGVPIGAMLTKRHIAESLGPGTHAATFGGNPLVSAAAIAAVTTVIEENLPGNAAKMGEYFMGKLLDLKDKFPQVIEGVRGRGLIIGLVLKIDGKPVASNCIDNGLLTICTMDHVLRFLPPLIISEKHVDEAVEIVEKVLSDV
ncbi:TPA: aspartate aminotransferase family protein [Candidatus Poribacteria bacterium]|nr:aspartate aminotransferase family protein [Candidatus Poribacteria bacterium]